jgi:hypothetical protein
LQRQRDPEEVRAYELWLEYYERTEAYDRTVCTGPRIRGAVMPRTPEQARLINEHARKLYSETLSKIQADDLRLDVINDLRRAALEEHERRLRREQHERSY